ncbi:DUF1684 domain-containing protein [Flavobacterium sp.]|jgi:uncharacterized protein (DUF1684 family)|uniref:DUF1684 domain-containing protein n=1 Tax=Flavobacterium sp. TaxID=239 RepID=UPI0037BEA402
MKKLVFLFVFFQFSLLMSQETAQEFQDNLNREFATREESPLTDEDFKGFKALDFYPISDTFIVEAKFVRTPKEKVFKMKTSTTRLPEYKKYGELLFQIDGKEFKLNLYQNIELSKKDGYEDYLFLPFSDLTCGKESYIGGRYIDMRIPKTKTVIIDFNKAYNPYCAYNYKYSCPIVPLENDLDIEILAGVKKFHD